MYRLNYLNFKLKTCNFMSGKESFIIRNTCAFSECAEQSAGLEAILLDMCVSVRFE